MKTVQCAEDEPPVPSQLALHPDFTQQRGGIRQGQRFAEDCVHLPSPAKLVERLGDAGERPRIVEVRHAKLLQNGKRLIELFLIGRQLGGAGFHELAAHVLPQPCQQFCRRAIVPFFELQIEQAEPGVAVGGIERQGATEILFGPGAVAAAELHVAQVAQWRRVERLQFCQFLCGFDGCLVFADVRMPTCQALPAPEQARILRHHHVHHDDGLLHIATFAFNPGGASAKLDGWPLTPCLRPARSQRFLETLLSRKHRGFDVMSDRIARLKSNRFVECGVELHLLIRGNQRFGEQQPRPRFPAAADDKLTRHPRRELWLADLSGPLAQRAPGPVVVRVQLQRVLYACDGFLLLVELPQHVGQASMVRGIQRRSRAGIFENFP